MIHFIDQTWTPTY